MACNCYNIEIQFLNYSPLNTSVYASDWASITFINCSNVSETVTIQRNGKTIHSIVVCTLDENSISFTANRIQSYPYFSAKYYGTGWMKFEDCIDPSIKVYVSTNTWRTVPIPQMYITSQKFFIEEYPRCLQESYVYYVSAAPIEAIILKDTFTVKNTVAYSTCEECTAALQPYYKLQNTCNDINDIIYTQTDLSSYIGRIVKISGNTNCYFVSESVFTPNIVSVTVTNDYETCFECSPPPPPAYYLNRCTDVYDYFYNRSRITSYVVVFNGTNPNALPDPSTLIGKSLGQFTYMSEGSSVILDGCWSLTPAPAGVYPDAIQYTNVESFTPYTECTTCLIPTFQLTLCDESIELDPWITNTDLLNYVDTTQKIEITTPGQYWPVGTYCVTITRIITLVGVPFTGVISPNFYANCFECLRVCYLITPCAPSTLDPRIVYNDFSQYVGKIIKIVGCPDVCWEVSIADTCEFGVNVGEVTDEYETCEACSPVIPVPTFSLHPRRIKPGYFSKNSCLSTDYIEKVNCTFAQEVYNKMIVDRYGITPCCGDELDTWDIKKQILDFELLTDPDLCKSTLPEPDPDC